MVSRVAPTPIAPARGPLARLELFTSEFRGKAPAIRGAKSPAIDRVISGSKPWLMESVSWGGVGLSAVLAGVGVIGLVGFESTLAKIGSGILLGGTVLTEIAAARLPVHAERRFREGGVAGFLKGCAVVGGFAALTCWNVIAGHFGMVAIDHASVNDVRAPLERQAAEADAARVTAEEAVAVLHMEAQREAETMGLALRGAFESGFVTSAARNARESEDARAARSEAAYRILSDKRAADRRAEAALAAAPSPRDDRELWGFALVLELLKGALVWFATASERRVRNFANAKGTGTLPVDPRTASASERRALKTYCASVLATLRHMEAARA